MPLLANGKPATTGAPATATKARRFSEMVPSLHSLPSANLETIAASPVASVGEDPDPLYDEVASSSALILLHNNNNNSNYQPTLVSSIPSSKSKRWSLPMRPASLLSTTTSASSMLHSQSPLPPLPSVGPSSPAITESPQDDHEVGIYSTVYSSGGRVLEAEEEEDEENRRNSSHSGTLHSKVGSPASLETEISL